MWLAFAAIMVTLLLQGMTLPAGGPGEGGPRTTPRTTRRGRCRTGEPGGPGTARREAVGAPEDVVERLRRVTEPQRRGLGTAWRRRAETPSQAYGRLRREMLEAEREVFRRARDEGRIPEEVLCRAQRDMDLEESMLERAGQNVIYEDD